LVGLGFGHRLGAALRVGENMHAFPAAAAIATASQSITTEGQNNSNGCRCHQKVTSFHVVSP